MSGASVGDEVDASKDASRIENVKETKKKEMRDQR